METNPRTKPRRRNGLACFVGPPHEATESIVSLARLAVEPVSPAGRRSGDSFPHSYVDSAASTPLGVLAVLWAAVFLLGTFSALDHGRQTLDVRFTVEAPLDSIAGISRALSGNVVFDPDTRAFSEARREDAHAPLAAFAPEGALLVAFCRSRLRHRYQLATER